MTFAAVNSGEAKAKEVTSNIGTAGTVQAGVVRATVSKKLPSGLFLVTTDSGRQLTASLSSAARRLTVRVIPGEPVMVRPSEFNPTRGQIV